MPSSSGDGGRPPRQRLALMRRCYLTPDIYGGYRQAFTRAAFSVIDCPHLTNGKERPKNSADICMVMDMLDTLEHKTRFDEFIIFSGDSDFTPVLLRLRAYNRRTTILTIGQVVEAYKAAADHVIGADTFLNDALGLGRRPPELRLVGDPPAPSAITVGLISPARTPARGDS